MFREAKNTGWRPYGYLRWRKHQFTNGAGAYGPSITTAELEALHFDAMDEPQLVLER